MAVNDKSCTLRAGPTGDLLALQRLFTPVAARVFNYGTNPPSTPRENQIQFKTKLVDAYRAHAKGRKLKCMLLGFGLPACLVVAGHIFKFEWKGLVEDWMGFPDIDDPGNGLLLFKPIEMAFDHSQLSFLENPAGQLVCRILDPALRSKKLVDALAAVPSKHKPGEVNCLVSLLSSSLMNSS